MKSPEEVAASLLQSTAEKQAENQWYNLRPILGCFNWAMVACLLGGREAGKSYAVTNYFVDSFVKKGIPFTWLRLTDKQAAKLLANNAEMLVDPDIRRKYNLTLKTKGGNVYSIKTEKRTIKKKNGEIEEKEVEVSRTLMARVFALSNFYNQKGNGLFDKDFLKDLNMQYHIALDEFEKEEGEKAQGDILYQFVNQMENLIRSTKERVKVFIIGNMLDSCADILAGLNFIPEEFGIYKIKSKRTVIDYMEPTDAYKARRKGSFADLFMPQASTFTNRIETDKTLLFKGRLSRPNYIVKFTKEERTWFTVWDSGCIAKYNKEKVRVVAMRPYIDEFFSPELRDNIFQLFDTRSFVFRNLICFKEFEKELSLLKPRK